MKISIIIPARNERENLPILIDRILNKIKEHHLESEIILVDDCSSDSTSEICDSFAKKYNFIFALHRNKNPGMGNALKDGTKLANGEIIIWIMADLSDDLNTIPKFLEKISNGYDMIFASRYIKGGSPGDLSLFKTFLSMEFAVLSRMFIGIYVHDITNAYRAFKKEVFNSINLTSDDFAISPEFALKAYLSGFKLGEVPTTYHNRKKGVAKFRMFKMGIRYFKIFLKIFIQKLESKF